MSFRYPQPDNEDAFEQLCLRLYRKSWKNEGLKLYGKRGEKQDGVDIYDPFSLPPARAVQCKHHEPIKTIPPAEIKEEVRKAEGSVLKIELFVIATTAKKTKNAQDTVAKLNQRPNRKFLVDIHFWEDICQEASQLGRVNAELIIYGENILAGAMNIEPVNANNSSSPASVSPTSETEQVPNKTEPIFQKIETLLDERNFDSARLELKKHADAEFTKRLSNHDQFSLLRSRGRLALADSNWKLAGQFFLDAYELAPASDRAKQNQVYGLSLLGETRKAYATANQYITDGVKTKGMITHLVNCVDSLGQLSEHESLFLDFSETDPDLSVALSHKYLDLGVFDRALHFAKQAVDLAPGSPYSNYAIAITRHRLSVELDWAERSEQLREAIQHYDLAEREANKQKFLVMVPQIIANRAAAHMLLGDNSKATFDYQYAVRVAQNPDPYAARAVEYFLACEDYPAASEMLKKLDQTTPEGKYLTLVVEYQSGDTEAKRVAVDKMKSLAKLATEREADCRSFCVNWALIENDFVTATESVPASFQDSHAFQANTLLVWISMQKGDEAAARQHANIALESSVQGIRKQDLRLLSILLVKLGDDQNALGLIEQTVRPSVLDEEMKRFIACAQRLDRHDLLLRVCEELRENGQQDSQLQKLELQLLSSYAPENAFELATKFADSNSDSRYFNAFRNFLIVRLEKTDALNLEPDNLPTPEQLSIQESQIVLVPYLSENLYDEALCFAYAQLRRYFEEEDGHSHYFSFFLTYGKQTTLLNPPSTISPDCAVMLRYGNGQEKWIIIEDDHPVASRGEFSIANALSQELMGRRKDDEIEIPGNHIQPESATICEIQSKYVRAFQDGVHNFSRRFPESATLQMVNVGTDEEFDPTAIIKSLEGDRKHTEKCFKAYKEHPCSLFLLADRLGVNEVEAMQALANQENSGVRCCHVSAKEYQELAQKESIASDFVLDLSAVLTITMLDAWRFLDSNKTHLTSQATNDKIASWIAHATDTRSQEGGMLGLDDTGNLLLTETTDEQETDRLSFLNGIKQNIGQHCKTRSSIQIAELDPDKRKLYLEIIGIHNLETIGVAAESGAVLWSDDLVVGYLAENDFEVSHVWTQLSFERFLNEGDISKEDYELATAKLAAWGYTATVWNANTVIAAGKEANWNCNEWPLKQCVELIKNSKLPNPRKAHLVLNFLKLLRQSDCIELKQGALVRSCLDALDSLEVVQWLLFQINSAFPIDFLSADYLKIEIQHWMRSRIV